MIYGFRHADPRHILDFGARYPEHMRIVLGRNFRSRAEILDAAVSCVSHNQRRAGKALIAMRGWGGQVRVAGLVNEYQEAHWVAGQIADVLATGVPPTEILALARTGYATEPLQRALAHAGIAHRVLGSLGLYERSEVRDALAYLTLLVNPVDAQALRRAVDSPRRGVGDATVIRLVAWARERHGGDLIAASAHADRLDGVRIQAARDRLIEFGTGLPCPALFDVTTVAKTPPDGRIEWVTLDVLELAPNARREISRGGIERLAGMLMRTGQLVPCIGHRPDLGHPRTVIYDGQRRLLAPIASAKLAGAEGYEDLASVQSLIVLLLDHEPGADEIRRIQAQANQRESLSLVDQQEQLRDCWAARAGLPELDRIAAVCADLGISPKRAHNLRRQLALPDPIRARVAERPTGEQISVTMANRLADMHEIAPQLTEAVAKRITSGELHDKALRDLGAFVHRTVVEDEDTYAVRIDDGAMLDAGELIEHARLHLTEQGRDQIAAILGCHCERLDRELDMLAARAGARALKLRITPAIRDRARNGRYAFAHDRGQDFAAGIWVVDPAFMLDLVHQRLNDADTTPAREEAYFAGARINDDELRDVAAEDEQRRDRARARYAEGTRSNLGLGHDIRAGLIQPNEAQLHPLAQIRCRLLVRDYGQVIAYGAGWTDPDRQRPVVRPAATNPPTPTRSSTPSSSARSPTPTRCAGSPSSPRAGQPHSYSTPPGSPARKALGSERMARPPRDSLPGGEGALRAAVWKFMRPMLSPALAALNSDAFVIENSIETTVDIRAHRAGSDLEDLELREKPDQRVG